MSANKSRGVTNTVRTCTHGKWNQQDSLGSRVVTDTVLCLAVAETSRATNTNPTVTACILFKHRTICQERAPRITNNVRTQNRGTPDLSFCFLEKKQAHMPHAHQFKRQR